VVDKYILKGVNGLFKAGTLTVSVFHVLIHWNRLIYIMFISKGHSGLIWSR
jgi:hypothetical protein